MDDSKPEGPRVIVFDCETRKLASEVGGWGPLKAGKGGISALVLWDSQTNRPYIYDDHTIVEAAEHLEEAQVLVGFNSIDFDVPLVEGLLGRRLRIREHVDILKLIRDAHRRKGDPKTGGNGLDFVSLRTLGRGKIDHGDNVTKLISDGRWGEVFNYCLHDVDLTKELLEYIRREGYVIDVNGSQLEIQLPACFRR